MPVLTLALGGGVTFAAGVVTGRAIYRPKAEPTRGPSASGHGSRTPQGFLAKGLPDAVVIVDPLTTGVRLGYELQNKGYKLIRLLSQDFSEKLLACVPSNCPGMVWSETVVWQGASGKDPEPESTANIIKDLQRTYHIVAIQIGCEAGVEVYDAITEKLGGFPTNGTALSAARRDKFLMGEQVRKAGVRAVRQQECCKFLGDAADFINSLGVREDENGPWCVLKPTKSAGTDGVYIAKSIGDARDCFDRILGCANVFGEENQTVLVQEFLKGKEYVVDSVSVEGEHKCVAIWEYDKRPCNGAQFVYFGMKLYQSADGAREEKMVEYVHKVLDALGIRHGPSHAEVMWLDSENGPCLVEVGARPHGGEGTFVELVTPVIKYSQVSAMVDVVAEPVHRFKRLPKRPDNFSGLAMEVMLVSRETGRLAGYPKLDEVQKLQSYVSMEIKIPVGSRLEPTVDFMNTPGSIMLAHEDGKVVLRDQKQIEQWQEQGDFYKIADPLLEKARTGNRNWMASPAGPLGAMSPGGPNISR